MQSRSYFGRQPARIVLVDLSPPFDADICHNLHDALEGFFAIVCSLGGPCRLPFCGMFALGSYPEALLPLQHTRMNFSRIQAALKELKNACVEYTHSKIHSCVPQGIQEAAAMFKRQSHSLLQTAGYWSQLEITVFTCQNVVMVTRQVEKAIKELQLDSLKKVQVVCISNPDKLSLMEETPGGSQTSSSSSSQSSSSDVGGSVDFVTVEYDLLSLKNYLKTWLHDVGTDQEHLHLLMGDNHDADLIIRCDLQERLLNPVLLPFASQFTVCPELGGTVKPLSNSMNKVGGQATVPVHRLRVIKRVKADSICESVLFGLPMIARATTCWKMDWDELESNQQHFQALCHLLQSKNEALLASLEEETPASSGFRYNPPPLKPNGSFLLLPSQSSTLLVKSIAVRDLLLPCDLPTLEKPSEENLSAVTDVLDKVESVEGYNPLLNDSGLCDSLVMHLTKNTPAGQGKRRMPTPATQVTRGNRGRGTSKTPWPGDSIVGPTDQKRLRQVSGKTFYGHQSFPTEL